MTFRSACAMLMLSAFVLAASAAAEPMRRVLVVNSHHEGFAWTDGQLAGFRAALAERYGAAGYDLVVVNLESRRFPGLVPQAEARCRELFAAIRPDLVFATDNVAWDFLKDASFRIAAGVPLVFAGVNDYVDDPALRRARLATGVAENFTAGRHATLDAALDLLPETKRFLFILDASGTCSAIRAEIDAMVPQFSGQTFDFVVEEGIEAQVALVAAQKPGTVVVPVGIHRDAAGNVLTYEACMERLAGAAQVPLVGFIENRIGCGLLGGKILTAYSHGHDAGVMAVRVLDGTSVMLVEPVLESDGEFVFDWKVIERFRLDPSRLPPGARVINRPEDLLKLHLPMVVTAVAVFVFLLMAVGLLLAGRGRLKRLQGQLEASEQVLESYFENSPNAIFVADDSGRYTRVNRRAEEYTGYPRDRLIGMGIPDVLAPEYMAEGAASFQRLMASGSDYTETEFLRADGSRIWMSVHAARLGPDQNIGMCQDISQRRTAEQGLRHSLEEKETLLRELYHRTKNNMYVMTALLGLYEGQVGSESGRRVFREMATRIQSMALVHEKLYASGDLTHVRFDEYVRDLVALLDSECIGGACRIELDLAPVELVLGMAVPLGLVLNELLINCRRHAFPDGRDGSVRVRLSAPDGKIWLEVADDGVGFPPGFDPVRATSMGLMTINAIVREQLLGTVAWEGRGGVRCRLSVMLPTPGDAEPPQA